MCETYRERASIPRQRLWSPIDSLDNKCQRRSTTEITERTDNFLIPHNWPTFIIENIRLEWLIWTMLEYYSLLTKDNDDPCALHNDYRSNNDDSVLVWQNYISYRRERSYDWRGLGWKLSVDCPSRKLLGLRPHYSDFVSKVIHSMPSETRYNLWAFPHWWTRHRSN